MTPAGRQKWWHRAPMLRTVLLWLVGLFACAAGAAPACPPTPAVPGAAQLQAAARHDRGFLWALQRDGRRSYLYGTLHVGKAEWVRPGPRVAAALVASDLLALEIDPGDPGLAADLAPAAGDRPLLLPAPLRERLARQVSAACLPEGALAALHPGLQAMTLGVLDARWAGLDPALGQEQALASIAREAGRPVVALESVALQKKLLLPDDPRAALAMVEQTLRELESGSGRAMIARLAQAWENGDAATLDDYPRWCDCMRTDDERAAMRALNDERNPGLAERIDALHREGRRVFAAVGALHLYGPPGLPGLLAARGFRVERVNFAP